MIPHRLIVGAIMLSIAAAACTTEQSSTPAPTLTSTTSTTTTTTPPTTTVPATTTPTTMADTTQPETTLPAGPVDAAVPLFAGGAEGGWLYIGAWQSDRWAEAFDDAGEPATPSIPPNTPATVTNLDSERTGSFGDVAEACFDGQSGLTVDVTVPAPEPPGFGFASIALPTPTWELEPRPVAVLASGPEAYAALGRAVFDGDPVDPSPGAVEQLVISDLDGDGDDEALVAYEYIQPSAGPGAPGDLAALLLVDVVTRGASTVEQAFVAADLAAEEFPLITRYRVLDVADLNGDGRMEVVVHVWYYEGASVVVYRYDGAELVEVLANGCGA